MYLQKKVEVQTNIDEIRSGTCSSRWFGVRSTGAKPVSTLPTDIDGWMD